MDEIHCYNDENAKGEYSSLNFDNWRRVAYKIVDENRISIGEQLENKIVTVFFQKNDNGEIIELDDYVMFNKKDFRELRKTKGSEKGLHLETTTHGYSWTGKYTTKKLIVFVRRN
jgi:hypothetical protein